MALIFLIMGQLHGEGDGLPSCNTLYRNEREARFTRSGGSGGQGPLAWPAVSPEGETRVSDDKAASVDSHPGQGHRRTEMTRPGLGPSRCSPPEAERQEFTVPFKRKK